MLRNIFFIGVIHWEIGPEILFYIVFDVQPLAQVNDPVSKGFPVCGFCQADVIDAPDFEEIHIRAGLFDDCQRRFHVQGRFTGYPCKYAGFVEFLERVHAVTRQGRPALP